MIGWFVLSSLKESFLSARPLHFQWYSISGFSFCCVSGFAYSESTKVWPTYIWGSLVGPIHDLDHFLQVEQ